MSFVYICILSIIQPVYPNHMEIVLLILSIIVALLAILGTIIPLIPGTPLSFAALLLAQWSNYCAISTPTLIFFGIVTILIMLGDYFAPIWFTKKSGSSDSAIRFSLAGMIVGIFFPPFGLIIGPFAGAFIGEYLATRQVLSALKAAYYSFLSFFLTTGFKLLFGIIVLLTILFTL